MPRAIAAGVLDAALAEVATATRLVLCSGEPANFAGIAAVALADVVLVPGVGNGDFLLGDGDVSGRKLTVNAQLDLDIDSSGTVTHVVVDDGSRLLFATTCTGQVLTAGGTVTVGPWDIELSGLLTQSGFQLAVAEAVHGHTAEEITLLPGIVLSVADALHAHAAEGVTLVAPTILSMTSSGINSADATPDVAYPAHNAGELVVMHLFIDDDDAITVPASGPGGETIETVINGDSGGADGPALAVWFFVANATRAAGTLACAVSGGGEEWMGRAYRVPAELFHAADPITAVSAIGGSSGDSLNVPTQPVTPTSDLPSMLGAGGIPVFAGAADTDAFAAGNPVGWTTLTSQDIGAVSCKLATRDALAVLDTEIASVNFTVTPSPGDSSSCVVYVLNPVYSGAFVVFTPTVDDVVDGQSVTLTTSAYRSTHASSNHIATRWQITEAADTSFASPFYDSGAAGDPTNLTELVLDTFADDYDVGDFIYRAFHIGVLS